MAFENIKADLGRLRRYGAQAEDVLRVRRALRDGSLPGA